MNNQATDDTPWWLKYFTRFLGSASSLVAIGIGAWACFTITARCLMAGILQMLLGVVVALIEVPCFCAFLDFAQNPYNYFEKRPYWHKALLYVIASKDEMMMKAASMSSLIPTKEQPQDVDAGPSSAERFH
ncbi:calcium channel flower-like isoform X6 [Limulus polyphemus]|uniref:Calcium channel flower n=1 Tax=Limulus polyphemus TaxID=6850 RepID=A0ABM1SGI0_LIMPO|nr:calcium channel flower-like isoform X6 [Limulus polyphemus]